MQKINNAHFTANGCFSKRMFSQHYCDAMRLITNTATVTPLWSHLHRVHKNKRPEIFYNNFGKY